MLLIDTYNVLQTTGVLPPELAGPEPEDLALLLAQSRYRDWEIRLICDGTRPRGAKTPKKGRLRAIYAGPGVEADSRIEEMITKSTAPKRLLIVSSDHRIRKAASKRRCRWLDSMGFLDQLAADAKAGPERPTGKPGFTRKVPLDPAEVRRWADEFGPEAERLVRAAGSAKPTPPPAAPTPTRPGTPRTPIKAPDPTPVLPDPEDPIWRAARQEWGERFSLADLDMSRWIDPPDASR
ncbi:MAG: NYN domain-containing protein [Planctomycetota bacterium]